MYVVSCNTTRAVMRLGRCVAAVAPRSALLVAVVPRRLSSTTLPAHHSFYIDGKWVPPAQDVVPHHVINPATEQPIATIALGSPADVDAAVSAAQHAFPSWSETSREERLALLERLAAVYEARQGEVALAISSEMGAPIRLATRHQAAAGLGHLRQFVRVLRGFDFEQQLRADRPAEVLAHVPIGVCALIAPWNWPMNQVCLKVAPALAAGCTAVLKPSEVAPLSSLLFAEMAQPTCSKCPPWQCPSLPPVPPQGAPGGSGQLGTPRVRPSHGVPSHRLKGVSELPPKSPISPP